MENIRLAGPEDSQAVAYMLNKMYSETGTECPVPREQLAQQVKTDGPGGYGLFECLIGFDGMRPSGFIMFCQTYDPFSLKPGIAVQHIYVAEATRTKGLGRAMMQKLAGIVHKEGWSRIDWFLDIDNNEGLTFFAHTLAQEPGMAAYRLEGRSLQAFARQAA